MKYLVYICLLGIFASCIWPPPTWTVHWGMENLAIDVLLIIAGYEITRQFSYRMMLRICIAYYAALIATTLVQLAIKLFGWTPAYETIDHAIYPSAWAMVYNIHLAFLTRTPLAKSLQENLWPLCLVLQFCLMGPLLKKMNRTAIQSLIFISLGFMVWWEWIDHPRACQFAPLSAMFPLLIGAWAAIDQAHSRAWRDAGIILFIGGAILVYFSGFANAYGDCLVMLVRTSFAAGVFLLLRGSDTHYNHVIPTALYLSIQPVMTLCLAFAGPGFLTILRGAIAIAAIAMIANAVVLRATRRMTKNVQ